MPWKRQSCWLPGISLGSEENAAVVTRTNNSITIQVTAEEPRLLVLSDTYYPGWQATIDGDSTKIFKTNVALRGVVIPPGSHTIWMVFRPTTFYVGVALSMLTVLVVLIWAGVALHRSRKEKKSNHR